MKTATLTLVVLGLTLGLTQLSTAGNLHSVNQDKAYLEHEMINLAELHRQDMALELNFDPRFEEVEYTEYVTDSIKDIYVTKHVAQELNLEKVRHYYVYEMTSMEALCEKIAAKVELHQPDYFSVDLYKDYYGDSGEFRYVARVFEYQ